MDVVCDRCERPLDQPGGLVFGVPDNGKVRKFHICVTCWPRLWDWIHERR